MTCFFLGTKVTPKVWLMTAFCTGSIYRSQTEVRGQHAAQDSLNSDDRLMLTEWHFSLSQSVLHCRQLQHPVIPCWSLGKVQLVMLSRQEMTGMVSSSLRDQWRLWALAMPDPLHYTHFLETERQRVWMIELRYPIDLKELFTWRVITGGPVIGSPFNVKLSKGCHFKMAHHIAPSVPIIIHIFSYGKVNIKKKKTWFHRCLLSGWNYKSLLQAEPMYE